MSNDPQAALATAPQTPCHRFSFIEDSGHGWLEVPRALIRELGLMLAITPYSYQRADFVYLEEDCDLATFWQAYEARFGIPPVFEIQYVASWVGRYRFARFIPDAS